MKSEEKQKLLKLIEKGKIKAAIDVSLSLDLSHESKKEAQVISYRYNELKSKVRAGILSFEQLKIAENQIAHHLIELIEVSDSKPSINEHSIEQNNPTINIRSVSYVIGILGSLAFIIGLMLYFFLFKSEDVKQLTVFVTDAKGNAVLEYEGELNIPMGNRILNRPIESKGRTNFADITANNIGDSITIGLKAEGWEIDGTNQFLFTGKPIKLKVKREDSLGWIKGNVILIDDLTPVEGAEIFINSDTVVVSDANGAFKILLPENMRIADKSEPYQIITRKKGYLTKTQSYWVDATNLQISLEKINQ